MTKKKLIEILNHAEDDTIINVTTGTQDYDLSNVMFTHYDFQKGKSIELTLFLHEIKE